MSDTAAVYPQSAPRRLRIDDRYLAPIFITCILLVGQFYYHILESYQNTVLAIITSIGMELALGKMFTGKWPHWASAYISGISVGILVRSPFLWPFALCSAIAITSKYVIRYKGRHLWNPSNLGISSLLFLAPAYVASLSIQFGNNIAPIAAIWVLGSFIIYRLRRFHITATYVASFIAFAFLRSLIVHDPFLSEISPLTGPVFQLYIFFMITDPKTTVHSKRGQMLVAFLIAFAENFFRLAGIVHAPYYALCLVGPIALLIDITMTSRQKTALQQASL